MIYICCHAFEPDYPPALLICLSAGAFFCHCCLYYTVKNTHFILSTMSFGFLLKYLNLNIVDLD